MSDGWDAHRLKEWDPSGEGLRTIDTLISAWNFESGSFVGNGWSESDASNQVAVTTDAARGSLVYGMRFTPSAANQALAERAFTTPPVPSYRFVWWNRIDSTYNIAPATSPSISYIQIFRGPGFANRCSIQFQSDNKLILLTNFGGGQVVSTLTITRNVWQKYDLWIDGDGSGACILRLYVDGILFCETPPKNWSTGSGIERLNHGFAVGTTPLNPAGFMDWSSIELHYMS